MVMVWTVVVSVVVTPAALIVPPEDAAPFCKTRLLFASRKTVKVPDVGFPGMESVTVGAKEQLPESQSWMAFNW
jgi:hypothetical protein